MVILGFEWVLSKFSLNVDVLRLTFHGIRGRDTFYVDVNGFPKFPYLIAVPAIQAFRPVPN